MLSNICFILIIDIMFKHWCNGNKLLDHAQYNFLIQVLQLNEVQYFQYAYFSTQFLFFFNMAAGGEDLSFLYRIM